jgi:NAD-dependent deacetylase
MLFYLTPPKRIKQARCFSAFTGAGISVDTEIIRQAVPSCGCGGILKPDFIFFEEGIPVKASIEAEKIARQTDVMLIIGSTGEVYPAAYLPEIAKQNRAAIIEINPASSRYTDQITDFFIKTGAVEGISRLEDALKSL